ncbi:MAG: hypothetical protein WC728_17660 [Elusimicrobiota bacterium]
MTWLALFLALCPAAEREKKPETLLKQDITIKGRPASGPPVWVPPPGVEKPVLDEVKKSLDLYKTDYKAVASRLKIASILRRLEQPFPAPPFLALSARTVRQRHDRWLFEVLEGDSVVYRTEDEGPLEDDVEWDGTDSAGKVVARIGGRYRFRFTGLRGSDDFTLESEDAELKSMIYREGMGNIRMEVSNALLFAPGSPKLLQKAEGYLGPMASRLGRTGDPGGFTLLLYQAAPESALSRKRAATLVKYFADYLLLSPSKFKVDVRAAGERGDCTACVLPPGKGERLTAE